MVNYAYKVIFWGSMKKHVVMLLSLFFISIVMACVIAKLETWNATVNVHNNSDYDVSDIWILGFSDLNIFKLEKGDVKNLFLSWEELPNTKIGQRIEIDYKINEKQFNIEHQEDAVWFKNLPIGHWEWEENGVKHTLAMSGEPNHEENEGSYTSLKHFANGAKIDIFIGNESYRIEGGVFKKIKIPLLPPWFRNDYPESYFEFDRPPGR